RDLLVGGHRLPDDMPGHAQEFGTSLALAAFPENVRQDMWADQEDPGPALSKASTGQGFCDRIVPRLAEYVRDMIEGRRVNPTPPYHP
ncbi:MAG: creatininase family protein, partial [Singulisphaera sp.]